MKVGIGIGSLLVLGLGMGPEALAQGRLGGQPKATVGEILKRIDQESRGKKVSIERSKAKLPRVAPVAKPKSDFDFSQVKPPRSSELMRGSANEEAEIERLTDQGINELYKLSQKYRTSPNRGELWLRLAEHYVEKSRLIEYRKQDEYDKALAEAQKKGKPVTFKPDLRLSQDYNRKAIQLYEWYLRDFPKADKTDQALFFLGYNFIELGELKKGAAFYERLTKEYPRSPYISEAYFALGEHYFDAGIWKKALENYKAVTQNRRARLFTFALYKGAWCEYRMSNTKKAILDLQEVIAESRRSAISERESGRRSVNRIRLATEALKDIIRMYAEVGDPRGAREYFAKLAGEKALYGALERLAYAYSDLGKRDPSRYLFKLLLEERPTAPKAFDYQFQIVENYRGGGNPQIFREELFLWVSNFGPDSAWAQTNAKDTELIKNANQQRESVLRNYTLQIHKQAQDTKVANVRLQAAQAYGVYIKHFPESERADEMRFFHGELLFDMGKFGLAAQEYQWVAENRPKSPYFETALLNSIISLEKILPDEEKVRERVGDSLQRVAFGEAETRFVDASERYLRSFSKGAQASDIKFKIGRLHYAYNHFDEALRIFQEIVKQYPKSQNAKYSANLILDIFNLRKDYEGLIKVGTELAADPSLGDANLTTEIRGVVEKAKFKRATDLEVSKDYLGSAKEFERFAKDNPGSELRTTALFNAAVNFERGGDMESAVRNHNLVATSSDKKHADMREKSRKLLGRLFELTGQYQQAAKQYEALAAENPKDSNVPNYYFNAAVIRGGLGQASLATELFEKYYRISKKGDRVEAFYLIAKMWEKRGNLRQALRYYQEYQKNGPRNNLKAVETQFKIADLMLRLGQRTEGEKQLQQVQRVFNRGRPEGGAWFAAEARLRLSEAQLGELRALRIPADPTKQEAALKQKLAMMDRFSAEMGAIIKLDSGDQIVGALTQLAIANENLFKSIEGTPIPKQLKEEEKKLYKTELAKVYEPFKAKALEGYKAALQKSREVPAYNDWVFKAQKNLDGLTMGRAKESERPYSSEFVDTQGL